MKNETVVRDEHEVTESTRKAEGMVLTRSQIGWQAERLPIHGCRIVDNTERLIAADVYDEELAEQIVSEHNAYSKLVEVLRETRHTLEVLLTCDHCAACEYCNSHKITRTEIAAIDAALTLATETRG